MEREALKLALDGITKVPTLTHGLLVKLADIEAVIDKTLAQPAQEPTSGDYALGYAEGFNDACKKPAQEPVAFNEFLESEDFYNLMQTYRHFQTDAVKPFEAVKDALRAAYNIGANP